MPTAYPTLPMLTKVRPAQSIVRDRSDGGTVRVASLGIADRYDIEVEHPLLDSTDKGTLTTFWGSNKYTVITITAGDGHTYDCLLDVEPEWEVVTPTRFTGRLTMNGTRAS